MADRFSGFLLILLTLSACTSQVEKIKDSLADVTTGQQAKDFLAHQPSTVKGNVMDLYASTDTTDIYKRLTATQAGNLIEYPSDNKKKHYFFKTLEAKEIQTFRVQYVYLDGKNLTMEKIDATRKLILSRLDKGESFDVLANEYSMDRNGQRGGDMGWFHEGDTKAEFENAIREHKTGDVFTVDVPSEKWYYVVRKSHDPLPDKKTTVLYLEVRTGS